MYCSIMYNSVIFFILKEIINDNTDFLSKYSVGIYIFFSCIAENRLYSGLQISSLGIILVMEEVEEEMTHSEVVIEKN